MKYNELYSLVSGQLSRNPAKDLVQEFFPLPFTQPYVLLQPFSKGSKSYDLWEDVLFELVPILNEAGYNIIQIGEGNEAALPFVYDVRGKTSLNQVFYLASNASLILGVDSFCQHLAGIYDIPCVDLTSNNYSDVVAPYFGNKSKQIILEPSLREKGIKPSFSLEEQPFSKQINTIRSEEVIASVCKLLKLEYKNNLYNTVYQSPLYINKLIDVIPDQVVNHESIGVDNIIYRMDVVYSEKHLVAQTNLCSVSIITDRAIPAELLNQIKPRVFDIHYVITENHDPKFCEMLSEMGIKFYLFSYLEGDEYMEKRNHYFEHGIINQKHISKQSEIEEIKDIPLDKLYYKSKKITLSEGKIYPSLAAYYAKKEIQNLSPTWNPVIDSPIFWMEKDHFCFGVLK